MRKILMSALVLLVVGYTAQAATGHKVVKGLDPSVEIKLKEAAKALGARLLIVVDPPRECSAPEAHVEKVTKVSEKTPAETKATEEKPATEEKTKETEEPKAKEPGVEASHHGHHEERKVASAKKMKKGCHFEENAHWGLIECTGK